MLIDKMEAICPALKESGFRISYPLQNPDNADKQTSFQLFKPG